LVQKHEIPIRLIVSESLIIRFSFSRRPHLGDAARPAARASISDCAVFAAGIGQDFDDDLGTNPNRIAHSDWDRGLDSRGHGFASRSERAWFFSSAMRCLDFSTASLYPATVGWELRKYCRIISSAWM